MRLLFLGRNAAAGEVLRAAVRMGWEIPLVVAPGPEGGREYCKPPLRDVAHGLGLRVGTLESLKAAVASGSGEGTFDVLLSFLFWRMIPAAVFNAAGVGGFNMHPGPLPGYRGARGYNYAILEGATRYGATLHWLSERFDDGDISQEVSVPVRPSDTALSLYRRTMAAAVDMTVTFLEDTLAGKQPNRRPQVGEPRWANRRELLEQARVTMDDDSETATRKARAFWFPPFHGATIEIGGTEFTIVDSTILEGLGAEAHGAVSVQEDDE